MKLLLVWVVLLLQVTASSAAPSYSDANQFWQAFRNAVIKNDSQQIAALTRFPFEVHGVVDSDPVTHYDRKRFTQVLVQILAQRVFLPSNGKYTGKSMRQLIGEKKKIVDKDFLTPDIVRFHDLEFELVKGRWLLTKGYLDE